MPRAVEALPQLHGPSHWVGRYLLAVGIVAAATLLRALVDPLVHDQIPYFIYVASVVVATWFCGVGAGFFSTALAGLVGNYLFVSPRYEFIPQGEDWVALALFGAVALGLVWLVGRWSRAELTLRAQADDLRRLHAEAERVNRVKDEFLATLSHELRTPLNVIVGWSHQLVAGRLSAAEQQDAVKTILRNADAQVHLIEDLLDVSRIISGKLHLQRAMVDLAAVAASALDLVRPAADAKSIDLRVALAPGSILAGDTDRLRQIAWNLVSNAVKFTPKHGQVDVSVDREASQIQLTVSDTGVGIEPEFLPRIFDRFTQEDGSTTRRFGGLGLGLAVVRHLVELHGGTVTAESPGRDRGATFRVTLPVSAVAENGSAENGHSNRWPAEPSSSVSPVTLRGIKVLVVDDEPDARVMVQSALTTYGAEVRTTGSAREAFSEVRNWRPDVLIADIGMPVEDGYSLMRRIRALSLEEGGSIPAAALTASVQREHRERALEAGFQAHLAKPVSPQELAHVISDLAAPDAARRGN